MNQEEFSTLEKFWRAETGNKTQAAIGELVKILRRIKARGPGKGDVKLLSEWAATYRSVRTRPAIKPAATWIEATIADGEIDAQEREQLNQWCEFAEAWDRNAKARQAEVFAAENAWRDDPMSDRQRAYLLDLGAKPASLNGITKGEASDRIDRLLALRDGDDDDDDGADDNRHHLPGTKPAGQLASAVGTGCLWIVIAVVVAIAWGSFFK